MGPQLIMFDERPLVDCIEKPEGNFVRGLGSCLLCHKELVPHFATFYTLARNSNVVVVRTRRVWAPY
jgi:hypothetical protein